MSKNKKGVFNVYTICQEIKYVFVEPLVSHRSTTEEEKKQVLINKQENDNFYPSKPRGPLNKWKLKKRKKTQSILMLTQPR